jgi:putative tricarboxylic transport membrane protein
MSIRLAGAAIFLIAAFYAWTAQNYTASFGDVLGPSVFPVLVGIPAMALALSLVVFPGGTVAWPAGGRILRQVIALAMLIAYALLLKPVGFPLATFGVIAGVAIVLGGPVTTSLIIAATGALSLWALFDRGLGLPLDFLGPVFGG